MSDINSIIIWSFVSGIIGLSLSFVFEAKGVIKKIAITSITVVFGLILKFNVSTWQEIKNTNANIEEIKKGMTFIKDFEGKNTPIYNKIGDYFYDRIQGRFSELNKHSIVLSPDEVKDVWSIILQNAKETFYATNTIAPKDWPKESCEKQRLAKVKYIYRVMIKRQYDDLFNKKLDELALRQLRECNVDQISYIYKSDLYSKFRNHIQQLGSIDIVLADNEVLLLTNYDEETKFIRNGIVTTDTRLINIANDLFSKLKRISVPYEINNN